MASNLVPTDLTLQLVRDDGAVIYLNGTEVHRDNMPPGPVDYSTRPLSAVSGSDETIWFNTALDPSHLQPGRNVVAVEIHAALA